MPVKILLVDDSGYTRKMMRDALRVEGFTDIEEASNGDEALKKFKVAKPHVVILDIILTWMDGLSVLKHMKRMNPAVKVIMVSAVGQHSYQEEAKSSGADGYFVKPVAPLEVIARIKDLIAAPSRRG